MKPGQRQPVNCNPFSRLGMHRLDPRPTAAAKTAVARPVVQPVYLLYTEQGLMAWPGLSHGRENHSIPTCMHAATGLACILYNTSRKACFSWRGLKRPACTNTSTSPACFPTPILPLGSVPGPSLRVRQLQICHITPLQAMPASWERHAMMGPAAAATTSSCTYHCQQQLRLRVRVEACMQHQGALQQSTVCVLRITLPWLLSGCVGHGEHL